MAKYNAANILGYKVLRYTTDQMKSGKWATDIMQIVASTWATETDIMQIVASGG